MPVEQSDGGEEEEKGEWFPGGIHGDQGPLAVFFMLVVPGPLNNSRQGSETGLRTADSGGLRDALIRAESSWMGRGR